MADLNDFLNTISSETIDLPNWFNFKNISGGNDDNATSDNNMTAVDNMEMSATSEDNATSDNNMTAVNNMEMSATSEDKKEGDLKKMLEETTNTSTDSSEEPKEMSGGAQINKLLSLLATDTEVEMNDSTATEDLENQLKNLLMSGGAMKKKASKKSSKKSKKSSKKSKKSSKKTSKKSKKSSKKTSKKSKKTMKGGKATSKKSKKASSKKSKKASKKPASKKGKKQMKSEESTIANEETSVTSPEPVQEPIQEKPKRKANPALKAFAELSKHVAEKLGIPNGPKAKKVAGAAKRETAEKFPEMSSVDVMKKAMEHFDNNMEHFKQML